MAEESDILFFRLRLPRELADMIADLAHDNRRPVNSQVILLLEQALGLEGRYAVTAPRQRMGASIAGSKGRAPDKQAAPAAITAGELADLRRLAEKVLAMPAPAPEKKRAAPVKKRPVKKK